MLIQLGPDYNTAEAGTIITTGPDVCQMHMIIGHQKNITLSYNTEAAHTKGINYYHPKTWLSTSDSDNEDHSLIHDGINIME